MQEKLIKQLIRDEGIRLKPYKDTAGHLTIGIGRNLDVRGITEEEADYLLQNDLRETIRIVLQNIPWSAWLDPTRFSVLVNMAFNLGITGLLGFRKMLKALKIQDYDEAAREMVSSKWAIQVGDRAVRLARQLKIGEWQ